MNTQIHMSASQSEPTNQAPLVSSLPWHACSDTAKSLVGLDSWQIIGQELEPIAGVYYGIGKEDATFIVTACNSHAALVERVAKLEGALQDAWAYMEHNNIQQFADRQGSVEQTAYCSVRALVKP